MVRVRILDARATLKAQETTIAQQEALAFELVSFAAGRAGNADANLLTLRSVTTAPPPLQLVVVDGALTDREQEARLNTQGATLVCYGTLFVEGTMRNVAAFR